MKKTVTSTAYETRYRQRATSLAKIAKWPAIGALIGVGALIVGRIIGPSVADELGAQAGAGFARGMFEAQEKIAQVKQQLNIAGWGEYGSSARLHDRLRLIPGLAAHGVVLQNPEAPRSQWTYAYEVRWLRGHPLPNLPATLEGYPAKLVIVDELPEQQHRIAGWGTYR